MRRRLLPLLIIAALALALSWHPLPASAYDCSAIPVGSWPGAALAIQHPIWCVPLPNTAPVTRRQDAFGGWLDDFQHQTFFGHLNEGDSDYHVSDPTGLDGPAVVQHWLHNNHWMIDMAKDNSATGAINIGAAIWPRQAFHFENRQLVLEADVAAGIQDYGGEVWPEMVWSTAPAPTGAASDHLYLYSHFTGQWASGCRLQSPRTPTCALEAPDASYVPPDSACDPAAPEGRLLEISFFQSCGSVHSGFYPSADVLPSWRTCQSTDPDVNCRDRFRLVWRQDGLTMYVNGVKYGEDSGWPEGHQIPEAIVNGSTPVYAYFGEFGQVADSDVYRFHWQRVAVNPHDAAGNIIPLSAAPSFCPGQPNDTCGAPSPTPTPSPSPFSITNVPCTVTLNGSQQTGRCTGLFQP